MHPRLQNLLDHRAKQGTSPPSLLNYLERMDWEGQDDHVVAGSIRIDGAPPPVATAEQPVRRDGPKCSNGCDMRAVKDGLCFRCLPDPYAGSVI